MVPTSFTAPDCIRGRGRTRIARTPLSASRARSLPGPLASSSSVLTIMQLIIAAAGQTTVQPPPERPAGRAESGTTTLSCLTLQSAMARGWRVAPVLALIVAAAADAGAQPAPRPSVVVAELDGIIHPIAAEYLTG